MLKCWQESPCKRPTFTELVKEFDAMLVSLSDKVSSESQSFIVLRFVNHESHKDRYFSS